MLCYWCSDASVNFGYLDRKVNKLDVDADYCLAGYEACKDEYAFRMEKNGETWCNALVLTYGPFQYKPTAVAIGGWKPILPEEGTLPGFDGSSTPGDDAPVPGTDEESAASTLSSSMLMFLLSGLAMTAAAAMF